MFYSLIIIILISITSSINANSSCLDVIKLDQGDLTGIESISVLTNSPYCSYLGIPYAKALRFQEPQEHEGWSEEIYKAEVEKSRCFQNGYLPDTTLGDEDCLFLNVFTPKAPSEMNELKAVIVYIHGGSFQTGDGSRLLYSPDFLINQDVILITFNYRLNIFGFLDLGLPECPGNVGLKDQLMALKWINKNIEKFGGDPDNVTIMGESAGAYAVNYLMISPLTQGKGLFKQAIMQSGSAVYPGAYTRNVDELVSELKKHFGFDETRSDSEFLTHLKGRSSEDLLVACNKVSAKLFEKYPGKTEPVFFYPTVEKIKNNAFLPKEPLELMKTASPVSTIVGMNEKEFILSMAFLTINDTISLVNDNLSELLRENLDLTEQQLQLAVPKVKTFYFKDRKVDENSLIDVIDLYSDISYMAWLYKSVDNILGSNNCSVYVYLFSYKGNRNTGRLLLPMLGAPDALKNEAEKYATHSDELGYLFYQTFLYSTFASNEKDKNMINSICGAWANFAKKGNPNGDKDNLGFKWTPSTMAKPSFLEIGEKIKNTDGRVYDLQLQFWEEIEKIQLL